MGKLDGSCLCGNVTYACDADPIASANCHCRDCQRASGAAFSTIAIVPEDSFEISGETLAVFQTIGDEHGKVAHRHFCSNCGSQLITKSDAFPGVVFIKVGTLDDTSLVQPALDVWSESKQSWTEPGERVTVPRGPTEEAMAQLAG
jgi:hypothetical protein